MKIEIFGELNYYSFNDLINMFVEEVQKSRKKIKTIQMISDFLKDDIKNYRFYKSDKTYYPFTVEYYDNSFEVIWGCWSKTDGINPFVLNSMQSGVTLQNKSVIQDFEICDFVPLEFEKYISDLHMFFDTKKYVRIYMNGDFRERNRIKFSQFFLNNLSKQITPIVVKRTGVDVVKKGWDICFKDSHLVKENGKTYKSFSLSSPYAECMDVCVSWQFFDGRQAYADLTDDHISSELFFEISDYIPNELNYCKTSDSWVKFIKNGGCLFETK